MTFRPDWHGHIVSDFEGMSEVFREQANASEPGPRIDKSTGNLSVILDVPGNSIHQSVSVDRQVREMSQRLKDTWLRLAVERRSKRARREMEIGDGEQQLWRLAFDIFD